MKTVAMNIMKIELWHQDHELSEVVSVIPEVGSHIQLDTGCEFAEVSNCESACFVVIRVDYWLNNEGFSDEAAVIVRNWEKSDN